MASDGCPSVMQCNGSDVSLDIGRAPSYVAIVSSTVSCLGSLLILLVYALFEDVRSTAQKIVTLLAIADLVTALGYIMGSANFLVHFNKTGGCDVFEVACEVQSAITSWSSLCSFAWTVILATHFYLLIVCGRARLSTRLLPLYHAMAWGLPLLIILPIAASRKLGYAPYAASNWCYVRGTGESPPSGTTLLIFFVAGKLWEIAAYVVVPILYVIIIVHLTRAKRNIQHSPSSRSGGDGGGSRHIEKRLLAIPLLFLVLRLWGTVQLFIGLILSGSIKTGCVSPTVFSIFMFLGVLQAIGDPAQGWGNAVLYVFLSPAIRHRLLNLCCSCKFILELLTALLRSSSQDRTVTYKHAKDSVSYSCESEEAPLVGSGGARRYEADSGSLVGPDSHCGPVIHTN